MRFSEHEKARKRLEPRFDAWCAEQGIVLTRSQRSAVGVLLHGILSLGPGRGSGKTFLLETLTRFLDSPDGKL